MSNENQFSIERVGSVRSPSSFRFPRVIGGICEYCGVIDNSKPSHMQYTLCNHFKEIGQIRCSYCDETKDPNDVIAHSNMSIAAHPEKPNKLVVWCDSFSCNEAHKKRFSTNG